MRAVALAARLDFAIDQPILDAIQRPSPRDRPQLPAAAARGVLQDSASRIGRERTFRELAEAGLLEPISAELHHGAAEALWQSLGRARRLPPAVRIDARDAHQCDPAGQPARCRSASVGPRAHDGRSARSRARSPNRQRPGTALKPRRIGGTDSAQRPPPRRAAACAPRRRAPPADSRSSAAASRSHRQPARQTSADPPQHLPRSADLARDSRRAPEIVEQWKCCSPTRRHGGTRRRGAGRPPDGASPPRRRRRRRRPRATSTDGPEPRNSSTAAVEQRSTRPRFLRSSCTAWPA